MYCFCMVMKKQGYQIKMAQMMSQCSLSIVTAGDTPDNQNDMLLHLGKPGLWRNKQSFPRSAFSIHSYSYIVFKLCKKARSVFCRCSNVTKTTDSDQAAQNARHLIRACCFCPSISWVFSDDVTC